MVFSFYAWQFHSSWIQFCQMLPTLITNNVLSLHNLLWLVKNKVFVLGVIGKFDLLYFQLQSDSGSNLADCRPSHKNKNKKCGTLYLTWDRWGHKWRHAGSYQGQGRGLIRRNKEAAISLESNVIYIIIYCVCVGSCMMILMQISR